MKKSALYFLSGLLFLSYFFSTPAHAFNTYYKGANLPSEGLILKNLKILLGPASRDSRKQGVAQFVLGTHFMTEKNTYRLYYCYDRPRKNYVFGVRTNGGCFSDISLFRLDTNIWIMKNIVSSEWIIISNAVE